VWAARLPAACRARSPPGRRCGWPPPAGRRAWAGRRDRLARVGMLADLAVWICPQWTTRIADPLRRWCSPRSALACCGRRRGGGRRDECAPPMRRCGRRPRARRGQVGRTVTAPTKRHRATRGRVGEARSAGRHAEVRGEFAYPPTVGRPHAVGPTLRSPYPYARLRGLDYRPRCGVPGGHRAHPRGRPEQPVRLGDRRSARARRDAPVRRNRSPSWPRITRNRPPRRSADRGGHEILVPSPIPTRASRGQAVDLHPEGNLVRHLRIRHGDPGRARAEVVLTGE